MSNVTPPVPAALERDTVKVNVVVPLLPSIALTSLTDRLRATTPQGFNGDAVFRGVGVPAAKSALLLSVSTQPPLFRRPAVVFESVGAAPLPSKKLALP